MAAPTAEEWNIQSNHWDFILFNAKLLIQYGVVNEM